jgi:hypothetical protein
MANYFWKVPVDHGDTNIWGPKTLKNIKFSTPDITSYIYDDSGTLKVSDGWIGINDGTVEGVSEIDTVTTISISGVSTDNWAEIYMSVSGTTVTFAAVDIPGATTEGDIPTTFLNSYNREKQGFYINSARRCIGIIWKTGGGALSHIINTHPGGLQSDTFMKNIYAYDSGGITMRDYNRNVWLSCVDGGKKIGVFTDDVESWDATYSVIELARDAIAADDGNLHLHIVHNAYYDGAWKYKTSDQTAGIQIDNFGNIVFRTGGYGAADSAITWEDSFQIKNTQDSIGIGGYAGGSNRDCYFYFATDSYIFWDESESIFTIVAGGDGVLKLDPDGNVYLLGAVDGYGNNMNLKLTNDDYFNWNETSDILTFFIDSQEEFSVESSILSIGGAAGGSNRNAAVDFASDARILWDESEDRFIVNKEFCPQGTGTEDLGASARYWNSVNYKTLWDRSALWIEDPDKAWDILKNARNEESTGFCAKVESRGQRRLRYSDFPDYCWDPALQPIEEDVEYDEENDVIIEASFVSQNRAVPSYKKGEKIALKGEATRLVVQKKKDKKTGKEHREISMAAEGFDLSAGVSVIFGGMKKCIEKIEALEEKIEALERKIDGKA